MRTRVLTLAATLAVVLPVVVVAWSGPAVAVGNASYKTIDNEWARGAFTITRYGWSVAVKVSLRDDKSGHCVYAKVELVVDGGGNDPGPYRFGNANGGEDHNNCNGQGSTTTDSRRITAGYGTGFTRVKLWVCEDNAFGDDCTTGYGTVNQNNAKNPHLSDEMGGYMTESMGAFLRHKANTPGPFDWSDNGCSSPVGNAPSGFRFLNACKRHDFGYRNYGHGLTVVPYDSTREFVDNRFRTDMYNWCNNNTSGEKNTDCKGWADTYHFAVRWAGGKAFYGD